MIKLTLNAYLDKNSISRYALAQKTGIRYQIIDNYYKNKVVRYDSDVLNKICNALNCQISDVLHFEKDE